MKVADVMSKQVDFVTAETSVKDISRLIFGRGINGVPVCKGKKVIGFITERDILSKFYPSVQEYMEDPVHSADFEGMEKKVSEIFSMTAEDIMNKNPKTVTSETPLLRAQSLMFLHKVGRMPVVNKKGELVGLISKGDIFRSAVGDKLELAEDEEYNDWLSKRYYITIDWKDRLSKEIPDLLKVFRKNKVKKVLDIGCGTGEHTIELAKQGYQVVGVDRSHLMINSSTEKLANLPEKVKSNAKFLFGEYQDVLKEQLRENGEFDAAIFMGNSISHNPYNFKDVIKQTAKVLSKNGIMIFQITNFEKVFKSLHRLLTFNVVKGDYETSLYHEHAFLEYYDPSRDNGKTILKTFAIFDFDGKKWKFYGLRNAPFAYATKDKIAKVLKASGLRDVSFYGSDNDGQKWDHLFRKPFEPLRNDWLNVVAKR